VPLALEIVGNAKDDFLFYFFEYFVMGIIILPFAILAGIINLINAIAKIPEAFGNIGYWVFEIKWFIRNLTRWPRNLKQSVWENSEALKKYVESGIQILKRESRHIRIWMRILLQRPDTQINHLLKEVDEIQNEMIRAALLSTLVKRVPGSSLQFLLDLIQRVSSQSNRIVLLWKLSLRLPLAGKEAFLLAERLIEQTDSRAYVWSYSARFLLKLPISESYKIMENLIRKMAERTREDLFSDIAPFMPVLRYVGRENIDLEIYQSVQDVLDWWK
jgi:hypothetical protein